MCPIDKSPLTAGDAETTCAQQHRFGIREDIPRLILDADNYSAAFGLQWRTYRTTQLDSYTGTTITRDRLLRCLGPELWRALQGAAEMQVLEVGCGAGRFTEIMLEAPAAYVTSVDFSSAVDANQENCPQSERHRVLQADAMHLPFAAAQYDLVLCLGVIQHTPSPESTIAHLFAQVKPGGWLVIDHYTYSLSRLTKVGYLLRPVMKRLMPIDGLRWTERIVKLLFPVHRAVRSCRPVQMALSRISPVATYFSAYPQLDDRLQYEWALLDTHDGLTDFYKHLRSRKSILRTLQRLGATDIASQYAGNGVEARCRKPSA